ncbi:hypothetical protein [Sphingomonas mollis]|uniref:O-antigen ligase domain-containing protein n=1 Tax=Sphingomonas mollis TaxID=2795726 RepID=A0ABS0XRU7_9SPHN|nr:hypothetical protein [Sphingomonas sp. BT553]MBJ6122757.1 hypothetical protein [Sphingomonas sp. BT553]
MLYAIYVLFAVIAMLPFLRLPVRTAVLIVFFGGWILLPVGHYPPVATDGLPWWIVGTALPSDMLVTKAWVVAAAALLWGVVFDRRRVSRWRPHWIDLPMAAWCLWPLVDGLIAATPSPSPLVACLYVTGCWGLPWLLGRIWIATADDRLALLRAQVWAGLAMLPVAIMEASVGPFLYDAIYAPHPFRTDGMERYVGYRPLGLLEHGNQYGIWICLNALAALWLAFGQAEDDRGRRGLVPAAILTVMAVAAQSIGALLLLVAGLVFLILRSRAFLKPLLGGVIGIVALVAAAHLSGIVPVQRIARDTAFGQEVLGAVRGIGRGSFTWRISQDTKVLPAIHAAPVQGTAQWDWFRRFGTRPWGLAMLIVGQFGLIGLLLAFGSVIAPALAILWRRVAYAAWAADDETLPLAMIVLLAMADATLNSFIYMPAILIAGAIAVRPVTSTRGRGRPRRSQSG